MIYSKYSTYAQEAREQIDGSILKEFFSACFIRMNAGLRPLFNLKPCIRFHIESISVSRLSIYIKTLKKYFFVCDERHPFEYASNAHPFNNLK